MTGVPRGALADSSLGMKIAIVGPVYPYRAGIAYCTTRLAEELSREHEVAVVSFTRQYPKTFYPGGDDIDVTLRSKTPPGARFVLDVVNPVTWLHTARMLRREKHDAIILVWWTWVWALPYLVLISALPRRSRVILQCHNIGDKEPAWWKRALTNSVLRRGQIIVVHARSEAEDAARRVPAHRIVTTFLPVHELGNDAPSRDAARDSLGITATNVALFFGHMRPFKGLDVALRAWPRLTTEALLLVAGEAWWGSEEEYRSLASQLGLAHRVAGAPSAQPGEAPGALSRVRFEFRFIPDAEIATWFAAADVVLAPYRIEAQSGVALTAFHFARPVIATRVGGLPEIIEEGLNGYLVPSEAPEALAAAIDRFFARADRAGMERAAAKSARKYSWEEYGAVFRRLISEKQDEERRMQNAE